MSLYALQLHKIISIKLAWQSEHLAGLSSIFKSFLLFLLISSFHYKSLSLSLSLSQVYVLLMIGGGGGVQFYFFMKYHVWSFRGIVFWSVPFTKLYKFIATRPPLSRHIYICICEEGHRQNLKTVSIIDNCKNCGHPFIQGRQQYILRYRGLAAYVSSVSFGHAEHCFLTVWTPKSLCQNLLKMTFLRRCRSCSVTFIRLL